LLSVKYSHEQYQAYVRDFLSKYFIDTGQSITISKRISVILKLWITDLTEIVSIIKHRYTKSNYGAPPKDAVAIFRSLILMTLTGETSITKWVDKLRSDPFYAILSGFIPACNEDPDQSTAESIPGVGTFYDFTNKLISAERAYKKSRKHKRKRKPKKKLKKNQKYNSSKPGAVERLVNRVFKYPDSELPVHAESLLNTVLKDLFVMPSLSMGILGDTNKFNIAGDGTCMPTHASHFGKKICKCKLKAGQSCECTRKFIDPEASWGWDSYNKVWYYGHSFHCITACNSFYSLPMHIKCTTAERHDSVTGIYALAETTKLYPDFNFNAAVFDSGYDAKHFYLLNQYYGIIPIISLNERSSKPASRNALIDYDENGIPHGKLCGHSFRNWGLMTKSSRRKWLFPVQCDNCGKCPAKSSWCKYTPIADNPRYFNEILRGSKAWRNLYKRRTTTERAWERIKLDYHSKSAVVYTKENRIVRVFLSAFCCYIDAWKDENSIGINNIFPEIVNCA